MHQIQPNRPRNHLPKIIQGPTFFFFHNIKCHPACSNLLFTHPPERGLVLNQDGMQRAKSSPLNPENTSSLAVASAAATSQGSLLRASQIISEQCARSTHRATQHECNRGAQGRFLFKTLLFQLYLHTSTVWGWLCHHRKTFSIHKNPDTDTTKAPSTPLS